MTNFRRLCFVLALMAAFTVPVLAAGADIHTPGASGDIHTPGASGDIHTPGASGDISTPGASGDVLTPGALSPGDVSALGYSVHDIHWTAFLWLMPKLGF